MIDEVLIAKRDPIDALPDQVCDRMLKQDPAAPLVKTTREPINQLDAAVCRMALIPFGDSLKPSENFIEIESDPNIDPFGRQDLAECWSRPMKQCGGQAASERALEKRCSERAACSGSGAVFEAPALVAGLDDRNDEWDGRAVRSSSSDRRRRLAFTE